MGLWMFLFDHTRWDVLYGKCSLKTNEKWNADGTPNVALGVFYATLGVACELIYIPLLFVMARREFIQHPCYKLMFLLGLIDVIELPCSAIIGGIQCVNGAHFCTNRRFNFIVGCISTSLWYGCAMTCNILAINRFFEICFPKIAEKIFGGKLIYLWLGVPIAYILYSFHEPPLIYSIVHHAFYFDPYAGSIYQSSAFNNSFQLINNMLVISCLLVIYTSICIIWVIRAKINRTESQAISKFQLLLTIQSLCICFEILLSAILYVYMQYFPISDVFVVVAHIFWICIHGDTPFVYLALNESLRKAVAKLIFRFKFKITNSVIAFRNRTPSNVRVQPLT